MVLQKRIVDLLIDNPRGLCIGDIASAVHSHRLTVMLALAELKGAGIVDFQKVGPTKLYFLKLSRVVMA